MRICIFCDEVQSDDNDVCCECGNETILLFGTICLNKNHVPKE